ncbi:MULTISPECIES: hypothetical protein [Olivibacter]|uniref:Uncharacterized protein n=1 Tax=Olivibacter jilunii TaxID=985016 RepID=A0ABW6AVX6_9SPHI
MKTREVKNIGFLLALIAGALLATLFCSSCGSRKIETSKRVAISETIAETKGVDAKTITETKEFGERLSGSIPVKILHSDSSNVVIESKGGKLTLSNKGGNLNFDLEAKPTSTTNTYNETHLTADSTATSNINIDQEESDNRKTWSLPPWVWAIAVLIAVGIVIRLLKTFKIFKK